VILFQLISLFVNFQFEICLVQIRVVRCTSCGMFGHFSRGLPEGMAEGNLADHMSKIILLG